MQPEAVGLQVCSGNDRRAAEAWGSDEVMQVQLYLGALNSRPACRDMKMHQPQAGNALSTGQSAGMQSMSPAACLRRLPASQVRQRALELRRTANLTA